MNESEWRTRKQRIDTKLRALTPQWEIIPYREGLDVSKLKCHAVEEFPTANGPAVPHTSHADQIVRICRDVFRQGDAFVQKITGNANVDRPLQRIREFRNRPNPKVVVTVDMLSTGVDIPALEFIVFLRPVKSRILWVQMLGRGTRKCPDLNKSKFVVFDCFDGTLIRYFQNTSDFEIEPPGKTPLTLPEIIENIWQNVDRDYHVRILAKRLRRIEKDMSSDARCGSRPSVKSSLPTSISIPAIFLQEALLTARPNCIMSTLQNRE